MCVQLFISQIYQAEYTRRRLKMIKLGSELLLSSGNRLIGSVFSGRLVTLNSLNITGRLCKNLPGLALVKLIEIIVYPPVNQVSASIL